MQQVDLEQNTPEWLEARKRFIGSSEVGAIMGVSPWTTAYKTWERKLGLVEEKFDKNKEFIFQKGHRLEDRARRMYELRVGFDIPPKVIQKKDLPYCRVSLDGLNIERKRQVEIKYVGRNVFLDLKNGADIPDHYYPQVQYQMLATGLPSCDFVAITDDKIKRETSTNSMFSGIVVVEVPIDIPYIRKMVAECNKFYKCMIEGTPPSLSDKDFAKVTQIPLAQEIENYRMFKKEYDTAKAKLDLSKQKISELMPHDKMLYENVRLTKSYSKGTVNYKAIPELEGVDLEKYRNKASSRFTITVKE